VPEDFDDDQDNDDTPTTDNHDIRQLREKAKLADEQALRITALERENAFSKALGERVTDPKMDYFLRGYDGPLEVEAIQAEALAKGFLPDPTQAQQSPSRPDLDAASRMAAASQGAGEPIPTSVVDAIANAKTAEEVMAIVESEQAAAAGLRSVRQNQ
jgi:hypothetical protein